MDRASETCSMHCLSEALCSFRCCLDEDIESFLNDKAMRYVDRNWCAVYLIMDEERFLAGKVEIEAYFTLSHKALVPTNASKTRQREAAGWKDPGVIHFVLIGQLGKYMDGQRSAGLSAGKILNYAFEVIRASSSLIPCRCALVECGESAKVHNLYLDYGFSFFQNDGEHHQFIKRV